MAGVITINFSVMKGGMETLAMKSPIYVPGPVEPQFGPGRYIYFEGFSVDSKGKQYYLDTTVAYKQTCFRVIEYLRRYGKPCQSSLVPLYVLLTYAQATMTIRSISYCHVRPYRATLRALSTCQTRARPSVCRLTSSTSTSCLRRRSRS